MSTYVFGQRGRAGSTMSAREIDTPHEPLLNCPTCGLPAEITDRFMLDGVPTPVEHVKLVCIAGHWYTPPVDQLPAEEPARHQAQHSVRGED